MDPVTHTLTGAALGRAGLERWSPLALPTLVLAANAPDVDVLAYAGGPYAALAFRRGLTHGLPAMAVLPFAVAGSVLAWDVLVRRRRRADAPPARPGPLLALSVLGLLTHPILDWLNTYGIRWLVPLSDAWSYGDALFIVDPWLWLLLGSALHRATPPDARWGWAWWIYWLLSTALVVGGPVPGAAKLVWCGGVAVAVAWIVLDAPADRVGRGAVRAVAGLAVVYVALMVIGDVVSTQRVEVAAEAAGAGAPDAAMVGPLPANPLVGDVILRTGDRYVTGRYRWLGRPAVRLEVERSIPVRAGGGVDRVVVRRAAEAASADRRARDFLRWSRFPRWRVERAPEGGYRVRISDLRYEGAGSLSGLVVELDEELELRREADGGREGS